MENKSGSQTELWDCIWRSSFFTMGVLAACYFLYMCPKWGLWGIIGFVIAVRIVIYAADITKRKFLFMELSHWWIVGAALLIVAYCIQTYILLRYSNNNELSFLGSYWGGILGGIVAGIFTLFVLVQTIKDNKAALDISLQENESQHQENRALQIMPYFSIKPVFLDSLVVSYDRVKTFLKSESIFRVECFDSNAKVWTELNTNCGENTDILLFKIKNVGLNTALKCDFYINEKCIDIGVQEKQSCNYFAIMMNRKVGGIFELECKYDNLLGNRYIQCVKWDIEGNSSEYGFAASVEDFSAPKDEVTFMQCR